MNTSINFALKKIFALLTIILLCLALSGCKQSVEINSYIICDLQGYNTQGILTAKINYDALAQDFIGTESDSISDLKEYSEYTRKRILLEEAISCSCANGNGLSNGDTVNISINTDDEKLKELGLKVKNSNVQFTVSGLEEITLLDGFKDLQVNYVGCAPFAEIEIINNAYDDFLQGITFSADKSDNLSNGDKITITASYSAELVDEYGCALITDSKEYIVDGLDSYLTSIDDLDEDAWNKITSEAGDCLESFIAANRNNPCSEISNTVDFYPDKMTFKNQEVVRTYLLTSKSYSPERPKNEIVLFYRGDVKLLDTYLGKVQDSYSGKMTFAVVVPDVITSGSGPKFDISSIKVTSAGKKTDDVYSNAISLKKDEFYAEELKENE